MAVVVEGRAACALGGSPTRARAVLAKEATVLRYDSYDDDRDPRPSDRAARFVSVDDDTVEPDDDDDDSDDDAVQSTSPCPLTWPTKGGTLSPLATWTSTRGRAERPSCPLPPPVLPVRRHR